MRGSYIHLQTYWNLYQQILLKGLLTFVPSSYLQCKFVTTGRIKRTDAILRFSTRNLKLYQFKPYFNSLKFLYFFPTAAKETPETLCSIIRPSPPNQEVESFRGLQTALNILRFLHPNLYKYSTRIFDFELFNGWSGVSRS